MRPGAEYTMVHGPAASAAGPSSSAVEPAPRSPWQSPVPYLFGGLAAMLGLIALSLLALACSYWKLAGSSSDGGGGGRESRDDGGEKGSAAGGAGQAGRWRDHVVVIMAGDERPTFLATPSSTRAADAAAVGMAVCCSCGASGSSSTEAKTTAECEASTRPAGDGEPQAQSPSEQNSSSHSAVITSSNSTQN
ncbi:protein GLUTAMINE DUMPER 4-like [Oryza brachyantha]|uniref:protein GLUTAMINE DUMPER 4-like n=1 Tax=Oryza brachyantha TaxID=4533 RepID=UPI001ADAA26E|nr:protein GLUTAMINE DUMPER 4-like [Oryza brachyantha]